MSSLLSKTIDLNISLLNPPPCNKYSPAHPNVNGLVDIVFLGQVKKVTNIKCGLMGSAYIVYYRKEANYTGNTTTRRRRKITQTCEFYNTFDEIPLPDINFDKNDKTTYSFHKNDSLKRSFHFDFPNILFLPSTCKEFGTRRGSVTIKYELYIDVNKLGTILKFRNKKHSSVKLPIYYQSGVDPASRKPVIILKYNQNQLFKNKIKKFYFDEDAKALIPSPLNTPHTKTRFIRQIWNDNYKSENYNAITKTIPIRLDFTVKSSFDLSKPFHSQLSLTLVSDLRKSGIATNQSTDFVFNGQSTKLGLIKIESLNIKTFNTIRIKCKHNTFNDSLKMKILEIRFENLLFDVKDFPYDKRENAFKYKVPIELLINSANVDINRSFNEIMEKDSIMTSGFKPAWFLNNVSFIFTWKISDGKSHRIKYEFSTTSTPDFVPTNRNNIQTETVLPPAYEQNK